MIRNELSEFFDGFPNQSFRLVILFSIISSFL